MAEPRTSLYSDPTKAAGSGAVPNTTTSVAQPSSFDYLMRDLGGIFSSTQPGESRKDIFGQTNAAAERIDDWLDYEAPEGVNFLSYMLPVIGTIRTIQDASENRELWKEHPGEGYGWRWLGDMGLAALSLIPGLGGAGAGLAKSGIKGVSSLVKGLGKLTGKEAKAAKGIGKTADEAIDTVKSALGRELTAEEQAAIKRATKAGDKTTGEIIDQIATKGIGGEEGFAATGGAGLFGQGSKGFFRPSATDEFAEALGTLTPKKMPKINPATGEKWTAAEINAAKAGREAERAAVTARNTKGAEAAKASAEEIEQIEQALDNLSNAIKKGDDSWVQAYDKLTKLLKPEEVDRIADIVTGPGSAVEDGLKGIRGDAAKGPFGRARVNHTPETVPEAFTDADFIRDAYLDATGNFVGKELPTVAEEALSNLMKAQGRQDTLAQWLLSPRTRDGKWFRSSLPAWIGRGATATAAQGISPGTAPNAIPYYLQQLMQQQQAGEGMYRYYNPYTAS